MLVIVCQFGEVDGVLWGQNTYAPARNTGVRRGILSRRVYK